MKKLGKFKKADKTKSVKVAKKNQIDFEAITKSFSSLDPQNMGNWPVVVKITMGLFIIAIIGLLAFMLPIKSKMEEITAAESKESSLLDEYSEKEAKARNLQTYKQQIVDMQSTFKQLLNQLPKETKIPDLVEDINMRGVGSGVQFKDILVNDEITQELFIEQPINIVSEGDYHEFGNFISGIANLSRITTMHDFTIENKKAGSLNELPELRFTLDTKTYRAKEIKSDTDNKEGAKS